MWCTGEHLLVQAVPAKLRSIRDEWYPDKSAKPTVRMPTVRKGQPCECQQCECDSGPWANSKIVTSFSKSSGPRFDRLDGSRMIKEKVLEG